MTTNLQKFKNKFVLAKYSYLSNDKRIKTNYKIKKLPDIIKLVHD